MQASVASAKSHAFLLVLTATGVATVLLPDSVMRDAFAAVFAAAWFVGMLRAFRLGLSLRDAVESSRPDIVERLELTSFAWMFGWRILSVAADPDVVDDPVVGPVARAYSSHFADCVLAFAATAVVGGVRGWFAW